MDDDINSFIEAEESAIRQSNDPNDIVNRIYNLVFIKHRYGFEIYTDIKVFVKSYIVLIDTNRYGYDHLSFERIFKIIDLLPSNERISLLNYLISIIAREYPEFGREEVQTKIKKVEIEKIFSEKKWSEMPNAVLTWSSLRIHTLIIMLTLCVGVAYIVLLPAPAFITPLFEVKYVDYSNIFCLNHLLNIISLFADVDGGCEVKALSIFGLFELIIAKVFFILLIVNFVYKKIIDKISIK